MPQITEENEALVMQHLQTAHPVILDRIVEDMPELTWNQIFETMNPDENRSSHSALFLMRVGQGRES